MLYTLFNKHIKSETYIRRYLKFVSHIQIKNETRTIQYGERHHILPKSIFKEYEFENFNIINMTPREHFIAHLLLAHAIGGKMWLAVRCMMNAKPDQLQRNEYKVTGRTYERIRIESSKIISKNNKYKRSKETEEQKLQRVNKWKENYYNKTQAQKDLIWSKHKQTRLKNNKQKFFESCCIKCRKITKNISRHVCSIKKPHIQIIKQSKKPDKSPKIQYVCDTCGKTNFRSKKYYDNHISTCAIKLEESKVRLLKRAESKKSLQCDVCLKQFKSHHWFNKHKQLNWCHLTVEEQKTIRYANSKLTMQSKSQEEKQAYSELLSRKRKEYLANLTSDEKQEYHNKLRVSAINYYNSDRYDSVLKSQQIRVGLHKNE